MKTFLIEREISGAGRFNDAELTAISQKSCAVLEQMGPQIEWIQSYVAGNNIYCIYKAESEHQIREHARISGFPANVIHEIYSTICPATAKDTIVA